MESTQIIITYEEGKRRMQGWRTIIQSYIVKPSSTAKEAKINHIASLYLTKLDQPEYFLDKINVAQLSIYNLDILFL